jgi:hypothetical protein
MNTCWINKPDSEFAYNMCICLVLPNLPNAPFWIDFLSITNSLSLKKVFFNYLQVYSL